MQSRKGKKLKGKIGVFLLFIMTVFFLFLLAGHDEMTAADKTTLDIEESLEMLSHSADPVPAFSESVLSASIIEREMQKIESVREDEVAKQHQEDREENVIYLTFDDGPSHVSGELLDILADYGMKATFFMMGPKMEGSPDIVERKFAEGHGLALHGMTHEVGQVYGHQNAPAEEMAASQEILETITGIQTEVTRVPYGSVPYLTEDMRYILNQNNFKVWDWNVDSLDWKFNNEKYVEHTIQEIEKAESAGEAPIVLLHDREATVEHLPKLLNYVKQQGYETKILTNDMEPVMFSCHGNCYSIH